MRENKFLETLNLHKNEFNDKKEIKKLTHSLSY